MLSFFGEQCLKDAVVDRVKEHQRLDQIIQGKYWEQCDDGIFRGCAIGCVLHSGEHMAYERQLGLPVFLAYLDEHIFESLPQSDAKLWPLRFIQAVPVGVDLELVFPRFMHWILSDPHGMRQHANADTILIIDGLVTMYASRLAGKPFDIQTAESAAWSAAWSARSAWSAWSAAESARSAWSAAGSAESAAESAAWSARSAAESASWSAESAWSAAGSAAWSARSAWSAAESARSAAGSAAWSARSAWSAAIHRQANELIRILESYVSVPVSSLGRCEERYPWLQNVI